MSIDLTSKLLIDGVDAYTNYGLYVRNYAPLFVWPTYKAVDTNDWHEYDAVEADLSNPVLDGRKFTLTFYLSHPNNAMLAQSLLAKLAESVYHTLVFVPLGITLTNVRYVSTSAFDTNSKFDSLSITFAEDNVTRPTTIVSPQYNAPQLGYLMDEIDFGRYGCTVTKGTRASMWKYADAKENLTYGSKYSGGIVYDSNDGVHLASRDIKINLHMHAALATFKTQWEYLWAAIFKVDETKGSAAGVRTIEGDGMIFQCFYKNNSVSRFLQTSEGVWCDFSVTFTVLAYTRGADWYYLATQDASAVTTEESETDPLYVRIGISSEVLASLTVNSEMPTGVKISQLPSTGRDLTATDGLITIGVDEDNNSVQVPLGEIMNALIDRVSFVYNVDKEHPLADGGFYSVEEAVAVLAADTSVRDEVKSGISVVFYDGQVWRVWQYQQRYDAGSPEEFANLANWMELAVSTNLAAKANAADVYTKTEEDAFHSALQTAIEAAAATGGVIRLTQTSFDQLAVKDGSTIYAVTNAAGTLRKIYLGSTLIAKADTTGNNAFTYTFPIIFQN